jgi:hypothetical protein
MQTAALDRDRAVVLERVDRRFTIDGERASRRIAAAKDGYPPLLLLVARSTDRDAASRPRIASHSVSRPVVASGGA